MFYHMDIISQDNGRFNINYSHVWLLPNIYNYKLCKIYYFCFHFSCFKILFSALDFKHLCYPLIIVIDLQILFHRYYCFVAVPVLKLQFFLKFNVKFGKTVHARVTSLIKDCTF